MCMRAATDAGADSEIYARYCEGLTRFAASIVGRDEAPDVVSDVRVLSRRHLADLEDPKPYLYKAVLNEGRSHLRARKKSTSVDAVSRATANPGPVVEDGVLEAVLALPPRQRASAFLVYWEGYSTMEAATLMGIRPGTISRYLHLARRHLRKVLDEDEA
jgi:RNA polymerase sigma factor (sigma-70 family)